MFSHDWGKVMQVLQKYHRNDIVSFFSTSYHMLWCQYVLFSSVQFTHSVVSDSLWPHGLQHDRIPCPSPTPGAYLNSCPSHGDAIQQSHPLSSPSPPAFHLSQHQGLYQWVSSLHQVAELLEFQLKHQSFLNIQGWFPLGLTGLISL